MGKEKKESKQLKRLPTGFPFYSRKIVRYSYRRGNFYGQTRSKPYRKRLSTSKAKLQKKNAKIVNFNTKDKKLDALN